MKGFLNTAVRAARNAGDIIIRYVDRIDTLKIGTKQHNDFVSEVDQMAEQEIIHALKKAYPDHAILAEESGDSTYLVPISAIAPSDKPGQGFVYIYDAKSQTVKRTPIKGKGATDNFAHIFEGINAGDVVASAGVSFLRDGQKVKLLQLRAATGSVAPTPAR